jgi:hypothetical protein
VRFAGEEDYNSESKTVYFVQSIACVKVTGDNKMQQRGF